LRGIFRERKSPSSQQTSAAAIFKGLKIMSLDGPRFLISRLSHIGDAILTLPLACELKRQYPDCKIAWAAEGAASKLLKFHPAIDRLIAVPRGWLRRASAWRTLRAELLSFRPEIAFDPQGLLKSAALARISGARLRIGFGGKFGREGSTWLNNRLILPRTTHLVDRTLELLAGVDITPGEVRFDLPVCPESLGRCQSWLNSEGLQRFLLLNPGAGWPSKQWPAQRFGLVAAQAQAEVGLPSIVLWAGDAEKALAQEAVLASRGTARLAPPTSLPDLAALASLAAVFVAGDTGPLHIAVAVGCPCVGLYGPTRPEDSGAYGQGQIAVQKWYQAGTSRQRRSAPNTALCDVQVEDVVAGIRKVLARNCMDSRKASCAA
jgi:ADP-heptose:LPS heptosyltransferase